MELKEQIKQHLVDEKEQERLKRIESNSKLEKITIYTDGKEYCNTIVEHLKSEGIKLTQVEISSNTPEWKNVVGKTNLGAFPTVSINNTYLVQGRDFQNQQQLMHAIVYLADPDLSISPNESMILETIKTNQYHLFNKLNQLEQKLQPIINVLSNLTEEINEEDGEVQKTTKSSKKGDCGCGKKSKANIIENQVGVPGEK